MKKELSPVSLPFTLSSKTMALVSSGLLAQVFGLQHYNGLVHMKKRRKQRHFFSNEEACFEG